MNLFMKTLSAAIAVVAMLSLNAQDFNWSSPPVALSTSGVDASEPCVVVDASGNAVSVWIESTLVKSSVYPIGGSWGAAQTVSGTGASSPTLGIDSSGNVVALWVENGVVKSANLPSGGSWSSVSSLSSSASSQPVLAVDSAGDAVAMWTRSGYIESATLPVGGSWSSVSRISSANSDNPAIAINASGFTVGVWHRVVSGSDNIEFSTLQIGNGWTAPGTVITDNYSHNYPAVAVDANGNAAALWFRYNFDGSNYINVNSVASELASGGSVWAVPTVVSDVSYHNPANLVGRIGYDSVGNILAMFTSTALNNDMDVESAVKPLNKDWVIGGQLVAQNTYAYAVDFSIDSSGEVVSVFMFYDGTQLNIQSSTTDINSPGYNFWSAPLNVSAGTNNAYPCVSSFLTNGTVNAASVWLQSDGTNNSVMASTGARLIVDPPTNVAVVQNSTNLGVFINYYNTISWTASIDPTLAGYNIYRNGVYWTQVTSDALSVIDNNAIQNGAVTYGVAAINSNQEQSPVIDVSFP